VSLFTHTPREKVRSGEQRADNERLRKELANAGMSSISYSEKLTGLNHRNSIK
jgi:hypothetical protein